MLHCTNITGSGLSLHAPLYKHHWEWAVTPCSTVQTSLGVGCHSMLHCTNITGSGLSLHAPLYKHHWEWAVTPCSTVQTSLGVGCHSMLHCTNITGSGLSLHAPLYKQHWVWSCHSKLHHTENTASRFVTQSSTIQKTLRVGLSLKAPPYRKHCE